MEFVTSTTMLNSAMDAVQPVYMTTPKSKRKLRYNKANKAFYDKYGITIDDYNKHKQNRFIERYFPRNEEEVEGLMRFLKEQKISRKSKAKKKPRAGTVGSLKVA